MSASPDHYSYSALRRSATSPRDSTRCGSAGRSATTCSRGSRRCCSTRSRPLAGRRILDVGTGTGRAAIGLAQAGARRHGLDASAEMLDGGAATRGGRGRRRRPSSAATRTRCHLPIAAFDAAVCLRVLMHAIDWRAAWPNSAASRRWRVVVDFPALGEFRRARKRRPAPRPMRSGVEDRGVSRHRRARRARAFRGARVPRRRRPPAVRAADRAAQGDRTTGRDHAASSARLAAVGPAAAARVAGDDGGRAVKVLVTGATGFTGGHLARYLAAPGDDVRALVRDRADTREPRGDRHRRRRRATSPTRTVSRRALAGVEVVYNIAALYREAGLPGRGISRRQRRGRRPDRRAREAAGARRVVHCSTVGVHGDVEHPPANEDAPLRPGDVYQETKLEGEQLGARGRRARRHGARHRAAVGHLRPGRSAPVQALRRHRARRFVMLGSGTNFYHLTYIDDLCDGLPPVRDGAGRGRTHVHPRRRGGDDAAELVRIDRGGRRACRGRRLRLPVWPVWLAGAACEAVCAPFGISPPLYRRRVDFFRKSRAFDISRARQRARVSARRWACARAFGARWSGTVSKAGSDDSRTRHPARAGPAVRGRRRRARQVQRARRRPAGLGGAAEARARRRSSPRPCRARSDSRCGRRCYPWLLGSCGRNVVFGQNVVLRHPHKIHIGDNVVIDDNCLLDAKGETERRRSGSAAACSSAATRSSRARTATSTLADGANIGFNCEMFSASRVRVGARHARSRRTPISSAATTSSTDPIAGRCSSRPACRRGITVGDGRLDRRRRDDPRRRDDRRPRDRRRRRRGARRRAGRRDGGRRPGAASSADAAARR